MKMICKVGSIVIYERFDLIGGGPQTYSTIVYHWSKKIGIVTKVDSDIDQVIINGKYDVWNPATLQVICE